MVKKKEKNIIIKKNSIGSGRVRIFSHYERNTYLIQPSKRKWLSFKSVTYFYNWYGQYE